MTIRAGVRGAAGLAGAAMLAGCARAPSFNVLGSYFPAWMLCLVIGIALAAVMRWFFRRIGLEGQMWPAIVIYPSLACFFGFTIWLIFFG
jgi:hypothetical protein